MLHALSKPKQHYDNFCASHKSQREMVFIDDREANLVVPKQLGMRTISAPEQVKCAKS